MTEDARVARQLAEEKVAFRRAEREAVDRPFRLDARPIARSAGMQSAIHLDLLRDMKLINSLIVAAAAYPVLDRAGAAADTPRRTELSLRPVSVLPRVRYRRGQTSGAARGIAEPVRVVRRRRTL